MFVGDDDQAALITAILTAALARSSGTTDPREAAALFQAVAVALAEQGVIEVAVAKRIHEPV